MWGAWGQQKRDVVEIHPIGRRILVKPLDPKDWPEGLGAQPETSIALPPGVTLDEDVLFEFGTVLGVGAAIENIEQNAKVVYGSNAHRPVINGRIFLQESEVWGTYSE